MSNTLCLHKIGDDELSKFVVPEAVRWLGAYGPETRLPIMAAWELHPDRPVAVQVLHGHEGWGEGSSLMTPLGLRLDTAKSDVLAVFSEDVSSRCSTGGSNVGLEQAAHVRSWDDLHQLPLVPAADCHVGGGYQYWEGLVTNPVYKAVVVPAYYWHNHVISTTVRAKAKALARLMGVPVEVI